MSYPAGEYECPYCGNDGFVADAFEINVVGTGRTALARRRRRSDG